MKRRLEKGVFETDHFHVLLTNRSQEPVRLWQEWVQLGVTPACNLKLFALMGADI